MRPSLLFGLLLLAGFTTFSQEPKGDRTMAWQVDMAENANYDSAYSYATQGCMESIHLFFPWSSIEPDAGDFDQTFIASTLDVIDIYHPLFGVKAELQIATVNTVAKETPADLMGVPFDDPAMIQRFKALIDTLFTHIPNLELSALSLGNEADIFWGSDSIKYAQYKTFLDSVLPHAKQRYSDLHGDMLNVGTTFTHSGLTDNNTKDLCASVNSDLDVVLTTYYPLEPDFTMEDPSVVFDDFDELVSIYNDPNQPLYITECGYSSSELCLSSEELQATFYENVFSAWDTHYDHIKYITIFKTNDWSTEEVNEFANYYGLQDTIFKEYLRTLGVRTWDGDGASKKAYETILCELNSRNWCEVDCAISNVNEELNSPQISLFPNPTPEYITVNIGNFEGESQLILRNNLGQVIAHHSGILSASFEVILEGPSGIYFVQVISEDGSTFTEKVVKD